MIRRYLQAVTAASTVLRRVAGGFTFAGVHCAVAWAAVTHLRASMPRNMPLRPDTRSSRVSNRVRTGFGTSGPTPSFRVPNSLHRGRIPLISQCRVPLGGFREIGSNTFTSEATMVDETERPPVRCGRNNLRPAEVASGRSAGVPRPERDVAAASMQPDLV